MVNILKKATDDVSRLIEMGSPIFSVDEHGYVIKDGEPYLIQTDPKTPGKKGLVIRDPLPDGEYYLINPYGEGAGIHSTPLNFFYRVMLAGLVQSWVCCTTNILIFLVKAGKNEADRVPPEVLKVAARNRIGDDLLADIVDQRMVKEFEKIDALVAQKIHLIYPPKKMRVSVHLDTMSLEDLKTGLGKGVREKTIKVYLAIFFGIVGVSDEQELDKFTTVYDPDTNAPPKMWCYLNTLLKVYLAMSGVLDEVGLFPKKLDLAELTAIIERIPEVFKQSRHVIQIEYGENKKPVGRSEPVRPSTHQAGAATSGQPTFREKMLGLAPEQPRAATHRQFASDQPANRTNMPFRTRSFDEPTRPTDRFANNGRQFADDLYTAPPNQRRFADDLGGQRVVNDLSRYRFSM